eukprot:COSAG06_NODE_23833_length_680_cov_1.087780_1_plen_133_part_10
MNWTFTSATLNSHVCTTWHKQQAAPVPDVALQPTAHTYHAAMRTPRGIASLPLALLPPDRPLHAGAAKRTAAVARGRPLVLRTLCFIFTCTLGLSIDALRRWPRAWSVGCWAATAVGGSRRRGCSIAWGVAAA